MGEKRGRNFEMLGLRRRALHALLYLLLASVCAAKENMQETIDRLLTNYSRNCNPSLALSQRLGKLDNTCGPHPAPNRVEAQVYIHRLGDVSV